MDLNTVYDNPNNLVDLFEQSVTKFPDIRFLGTKNPESGKYEWLTRKQIAEQVDNLRGALKKLGFGKGDKAGIIINNCVEWFVCEQAIHGLGGVFVPMYLQELPKIWKYIITDAAIKFLFVRDESVYEKVKGFKQEISTLQEIFIVYGTGENSLSALEKMGKDNPAPSLKPHWSDLAHIIFTSGTTGDPKGAMISHGNATWASRSSIDTFELNETSQVISILPWAHVYGQNCDLHNYTFCGGGIAFIESLEKFMQNVQESKPTAINGVPRILTKIYDAIMQGVNADPMKKQFFDAALEVAAKNRDLPEKTKEFKDYDELVFSKIRAIFGGNLKFIVNSSALLKLEIALFFRDIGQPTYDCYGMTETSGGITLNCTEFGNKLGTVGKPLKHTNVVIDKSRVGDDSPDGEICAYGPQVMMGYFNKPGLNEEFMMPDKWNGFTGIRTGDRGWFDEEGFLHITGRFKDEYKLANGKYVHPESVENEIKLLRYVANAMVYGEGREYNVAVIVPDFTALKADPETKGWCKDTLEETLHSQDLKDYLTKNIMEYVRKSFGGYEVPQKFLFIAEDFTVVNGMLTQTMKLKRANVLVKYKEQLLALY
jgi:long-chain acyl-CoA synthetase